MINIVDYYRFPQVYKYSKFLTLPEGKRRDYIEHQVKQIPLVAIYCFTFMSNHYHFLLEQCSENGIRLFISNVQNSFAKFHNLKRDRHGTLFHNPFKAKRIESDEQFIHLFRYIHLNHVIAYIIEFDQLFDYP